MILTDSGSFCSPDRIQDHIDAVPFPAGLHTACHGCGCLRNILGLIISQAVGTISTGPAGLLTKIIQDIGPQALPGQAVKIHFLQPLPVSFHPLFPGDKIQFLIILIVLNEHLVGDHILGAVV